MCRWSEARLQDIARLKTCQIPALHLAEELVFAHFLSILYFRTRPPTLLRQVQGAIFPNIIAERCVLARMKSLSPFSTSFICAFLAFWTLQHLCRHFSKVSPYEQLPYTIISTANQLIAFSFRNNSPSWLETSFLDFRFKGNTPRTSEKSEVMLTFNSKQHESKTSDCAEYPSTW